MNESFLFFKGEIFTNHVGPSKRYRTVGTTYLCIIPIEIRSGDSCITINDTTYLLEKHTPLYLKPSDIYEFSGPMVLSMTFSSPNHFAGEEEIER